MISKHQSPEQMYSGDSSSTGIFVQLIEKKDYSSIVELLKRSLPVTETYTTIPITVNPMEAMETNKLFTDKEWQFELCPLGHRTIAYIENGKGENKIRFNHDALENIQESIMAVRDALKEWKINAVIDGELIRLPVQENKDDYASELYYYVFDLLWLDGADITNQPLYLRQKLLRNLLPENSLIRFCEHIDEAGEELMKTALPNFTGRVVAKRKNSIYQPGLKSSDWLSFEIKSNTFLIHDGSATHCPEVLKDKKDVPTDDYKRIDTINIDGEPYVILNPTEIINKKTGLSRQHIVTYYERMADQILPYLIDRPLEIFSKSAQFQSLRDDKSIKCFEKTDGAGAEHKLVIVQNKLSLLKIVNAGCYELKAWQSRIQQPMYADWCIIAVCSSTGDYKSVSESAGKLNELLTEFDIPCYPKIVGNAIEIYIPLGGKYQYDHAKQFTELLARLISEEIKDESGGPMHSISFSAEMNSLFATTYVPYSLILGTGVHVAMPMEWSEINASLNLKKFTMDYALHIAESKAEKFINILGNGIELNRMMKGITQLIHS